MWQKDETDKQEIEKLLEFRPQFGTDTDEYSRVGVELLTGLYNRPLILDHHVDWRFSGGKIEIPWLFSGFKPKNSRDSIHKFNSFQKKTASWKIPDQPPAGAMENSCCVMCTPGGGFQPGY